MTQNVDPTELLDLFLHLDRHLHELVSEHGSATYGILAATVFCETGLVVTPFLPGDSLLFAAGALAASGSLDVGLLMLLLTAVAILGDTVNYWIGNRAGDRLLNTKKWRLVRASHIEKTHAFFERYGGKTVIIARFVPIVRTMAPFIAGLGSMTYRRFMLYNVAGALLWVVGITAAGYSFGNLPVVKENFGLVVIGIIIVSILPAVFEGLNQWQALRRERAAVASAAAATDGSAGE